MPSRSVRRILFSPVARLVLSIVFGVVAGGIASLLAAPATAVLFGITLTGTAFVIAGLVALWPMDGEATRRSARSEVLRPAADEVVVASAALVAMAGIVVLQWAGGSRAGLFPALLTLLAVFLAWASLHMMYATRYAFVYYDEEAGGGIDFFTRQEPSYRDFLYLSFAIGMTYGVTDNSISSTALRAIVLRHAVLSFVFGTVILASVISVVAGALST